MKRTKFLEIVLAITNSQSSSFAALDNINVRFGTENFQNIRRLIFDVSETFKRGISKEAVETLSDLCNNAETFLKHTFTSHLQPESECATHCIRFALSDKTAKSAMKPYGHSHKKFCKDCELPYKLFHQLRSVVEMGD